MGAALPEETPGHQGDEARQLKEEIERTREHLAAAALVVWQRRKR